MRIPSTVNNSQPVIRQMRLRRETNRVQFSASDDSCVRHQVLTTVCDITLTTASWGITGAAIPSIKNPSNRNPSTGYCDMNWAHSFLESTSYPPAMGAIKPLLLNACEHQYSHPLVMYSFHFRGVAVSCISRTSYVLTFEDVCRS